MRSPLVVPSGTIPAVASRRYHHECMPWMPIGFVGSLVTFAPLPFHAGHQVVVGLRFDFEDVPFEVQPERRVGSAPAVLPSSTPTRPLRSQEQRERVLWSIGVHPICFHHWHTGRRDRGSLAASQDNTAVALDQHLVQYLVPDERTRQWRSQLARRAGRCSR